MTSAHYSRTRQTNESLVWKFFHWSGARETISALTRLYRVALVHCRIEYGLYSQVLETRYAGEIIICTLGSPYSIISAPQNYMVKGLWDSRLAILYCMHSLQN